MLQKAADSNDKQNLFAAGIILLSRKKRKNERMKNNE